MQRATANCKYCGKPFLVEHNTAADDELWSRWITLICPDCKKEAQYQAFELKSAPKPGYLV
jgi:hypothetical protein